MGSIQPNIPNTPNNVGDSWEPLVGQHVICRQGDNHVSLTEWSIANTDRPLVAGGSSIEVNGSIVSWPGDTAIVNDTGLASGTVYLLIDTSGAVNGIPTLVNDAPVWVTSKNGFYRGANERYTGHQMEWDGATTYTTKTRIFNKSGETGLRIEADGSLQVPRLTVEDSSGWAGTYGYHSVSTAGWIPPAGAYMFARAYGVYVQVKDNGSSWKSDSYGNYAGGQGGFFVTDGASYRLVAKIETVTQYYRKIW